MEDKKDDGGCGVLLINTVLLCCICWFVGSELKSLRTRIVLLEKAVGVEALAKVLENE